MKNNNKVSNVDKKIIEEIELGTFQTRNWKTYFKLTPYKVSILGVIVALNILLSLISVYALAPFTMAGFLRVEISFLTYLIAWKLVNGFYALLIITPTTWLRYAGIDPNAEPIGMTSMNLSDLFALATFIGLSFIFQLKNDEVGKMKFHIKFIFVAILVSLLTGVWNIFLNFSFILDLYSTYFGVEAIQNLKNWAFAGLLIFFNLIKYVVNFWLFLTFYETIKIIYKKRVFS
ncbi:ECF transporter S component [Spiroplasma gladiatoris]|uniref:ECF transporter S component n=1 Tax=Spiroplasma gladiatoris TaxID=2143 RepID=A0A4P7AH53_9MOLU|nr:hypothetical protein [Spiroplasma gladiatoris]QBQ07497.1 ECF transporter S component [Spiroplasma gladiatoris]